MKTSSKTIQVLANSTQPLHQRNTYDKTRFEDRFYYRHNKLSELITQIEAEMKSVSDACKFLTEERKRVEDMVANIKVG